MEMQIEKDCVTIDGTIVISAVKIHNGRWRWYSSIWQIDGKKTYKTSENAIKAAVNKMKAVGHLTA